MNMELEKDRSVEEDSSLITIPLAALLEYCDPTLDDPWGCGKIASEDVLSEVGYSTMRAQPLEYEEELYRSYEYNIQRIAFFVQEGWIDSSEDREPITLDIGIEGYTGPWLIVDGNHRVAAAKVRGDESILVDVIGDMDKAEAVFLRGVHPDDYSRLEHSAVDRSTLRA